MLDPRTRDVPTELSAKPQQHQVEAEGAEAEAEVGGVQPEAEHEEGGSEAGLAGFGADTGGPEAAIEPSQVELGRPPHASPEWMNSADALYPPPLSSPAASSAHAPHGSPHNSVAVNAYSPLALSSNLGEGFGDYPSPLPLVLDNGGEGPMQPTEPERGGHNQTTYGESAADLVDPALSAAPVPDVGHVVENRLFGSDATSATAPAPAPTSVENSMSVPCEMPKDSKKRMRSPEPSSTDVAGPNQAIMIKSMGQHQHQAVAREGGQRSQTPSLVSTKLPASTTMTEADGHDAEPDPGSGSARQPDSQLQQERRNEQENDEEELARARKKPRTSQSHAWTVWEALSQDEAARLRGNKWLKDDVVHALLSTIVSVYPNYIAFSPFEMQSESSCALPALVSLFGDEITHVLFVTNYRGNHWMAGMLDLGTGHCNIYDSLHAQGTVRPDLQQTLTQSFARLLPADAIREWVFTLLPCPQQPNAFNCGVFALATVWHLASSVCLPLDFTGRYWRLVFAALVSGSELTAQLPLDLTDDASDPMSPPPPPPAAYACQSETANQGALDAVDTILAQIDQQHRQLKHSLAIWTQRRTLAEEIANYLEAHVQPLVSAWLAASSSKDLEQIMALRLEDVSESKKNYEVLHEQAIQMGTGSRRRASRELVPGSRQKQIEIAVSCVRIARLSQSYLTHWHSIREDGKQRLSSLRLDKSIATLNNRALTYKRLESKASAVSISVSVGNTTIV